MQALSNILPAVMSQTVTPREPQHGLTTTGGTTNQGLSVRREQPLTDVQLTEIASQTLQGPLEICSEKVVVYGRKLITDGGDAYYAENEPIGEKTEVTLAVAFKENTSLPMLRAALALSPQSATLKHLTHLAMHKKFGSNDTDRAILLSDYIKALSGFPEFVLYAVCRTYWEKDRRPFVPYIDEMTEACDLLQGRFEAFLRSKTKLSEPLKEVSGPVVAKEEPWHAPTENEKQSVSEMMSNLYKTMEA